MENLISKLKYIVLKQFTLKIEKVEIKNKIENLKPFNFNMIFF
jgi:hypothetical protein